MICVIGANMISEGFYGKDGLVQNTAVNSDCDNTAIYRAITVTGIRLYGRRRYTFIFGSESHFFLRMTAYTVDRSWLL